MLEKAICISKVKRAETTHFRSIEPIVVIVASFRFIREHFIGLGYLSEFLFSFFFVVGIFIRMPFDS